MRLLVSPFEAIVSHFPDPEHSRASLEYEKCSSHVMGMGRGRARDESYGRDACDGTWGMGGARGQGMGHEEGRG